MLPHRFHGFLLRKIFDLGSLFDCRGAAEDGVQEAHQLRFAVLRFEDAYPQKNSRHGSTRSDGGLLRFANDKIAKLWTPGKREKGRLSRGFPARGEWAF